MKDFAEDAPRPGRRAFHRAALASLMLPLLARAQRGGTDSPNKTVYMYRGPDREARLLAEAKKQGTGGHVHVAQPQGLGADHRGLREAHRAQGGAVAREQREGSAARRHRGARRALLARTSSRPTAPRWRRSTASSSSTSSTARISRTFRPAAFPKHRHYVADRFNFFTIGYNTNLVKPDEVPRSYTDLLDRRLGGPRGPRGRRRRLVRRHGEVHGRGEGHRLLPRARGHKPAGAQRAHAHGRAAGLGRDPVDRRHLQPQRRAAEGEGRARGVEGARPHVRPSQRHRRRKPRAASARRPGVRGLHAVARRPGAHQEAQPRALEPRGGHEAQQLPVPHDRSR